MKIVFAGDISFDWLKKPRSFKLLSYLFRKSSLKKRLAEEISRDAGLSRLTGIYRRAQIELQSRQIAAGLQPILSRADFVCANLECALSSRGKPLEDKRYTLRAEPFYIAALKQFGITYANLANNHILDYGPEAMADTCHYLDLAGINYFGLCDGQSSQRPVVIDDGNNRLALLGYVEPSIITPDPDSFFRHSPSPCPLEPDGIIEDIRRYSDDHAVIVVLHWGVEWSHLETEAQRRLARRMIDAGAAAVVGHHTHLVGGVEKYKGGIIAYSLGNLLMVLPPFAARRASTRVMLQVQLDGNRLSDFRLVPVSDNADGYPVEGDFKVESLMHGYMPEWLPPASHAKFDSYADLPSAWATLENRSGKADCQWSDDYLVVEDIVPLYRIPMGPGWRAKGPGWAGTARTRELMGREFLPVNITHLAGDEIMKIRFLLKEPISKLSIVFGYPESMRILKEFNCPSVKIRAGDKTIAEFILPEKMSDWQRREISTDRIGKPLTEIEVVVRGRGNKYGLICWRLLGS